MHYTKCNERRREGINQVFLFLVTRVVIGLEEGVFTGGSFSIYKKKEQKLSELLSPHKLMIPILPLHVFAWIPQGSVVV